MNFDIACDRLLKNEGGYNNIPEDPGGETNWGISKRQYPNVDIANLSRDEAKEIYRRDYWEPLLDANPAIKYQVFDFAVNGGLSVAVQKLQFAIGVADDGHWGPVSAAKLSSMDVNDVLMRFNAQRLKFYAKLSTFKTFGAGWVIRVAENLNYAAEDN